MPKAAPAAVDPFASTVPTVTSRLAGIKPAKLKEPRRYLFYGMEGVGKSSLAADAPSPIFFDVEGGSGELELVRYPFRTEEGGHIPRKYEEVVAAIEDLTTSAHDYKTLVVDTLDRLESLIWTRCCEKSGKGYTSIEDFGYGKGYVAALDVWRELVLKLDRLRQAKKMDIVLLGHSQVKTFHSPEADDWDRYLLRLHDKAAGFVKEWCDVVGFASFEEGAKVEKGERTKGWSTGARILRFERTAAFDAKTRVPLPAEVELAPSHPWAPLATAMKEGEALPLPEILARVKKQIPLVRKGGGVSKAEAYAQDLYDRSDREGLLHCLMELLRSPPVTNEPT